MAPRKIDLDQLPSNSRTKQDKEVAVAKGRVKSRPGVAGQMRNIGNSLFEEVVMPNVADIIIDFFSQGIQMLVSQMLGGEIQPRRGRHHSYNKLYRTPTQSVKSGIRRARPHVVDQIDDSVYEDIFFESRIGAQRVLGRMMEKVGEFGHATVGDVNALAGLATNYTQQGWGWTDLSGTKVHYTSDGYVIGFPDPEWLG